jgi:MoaA/NifB/PqqE/SkfB family radical SAM enzyme
MCYTAGHRIRGNQVHLELQETVQMLLAPGRELDLQGLTISGGEPLLAPGLMETVRAALDLGYSIKLLTSLFPHSPKKLELLLSLMDSPRHQIVVSYDSFKPAEVRQVRGRGSGELVTASIRWLVKKRAELGSQVRLSSNTVLQPANAGSLLNTLSFLLDELGFDQAIVQQRHDYTNISPGNIPRQAALRRSPAEIQLLAQAARQVFALAESNPRLAPAGGKLEDWLQFLTNPLDSRISCQALSYIYIDAFGNYRGCIHSTLLGSLRRTPLAEYLQSGPFLEFASFSQGCHLCTHSCS